MNTGGKITIAGILVYLLWPRKKKREPITGLETPFTYAVDPHGHFGYTFGISTDAQDGFITVPENNTDADTIVLGEYMFDVWHVDDLYFLQATIGDDVTRLSFDGSGEMVDAVELSY